VSSNSAYDALNVTSHRDWNTGANLVTSLQQAAEEMNARGDGVHALSSPGGAGSDQARIMTSTILNRVIALTGMRPAAGQLQQVPGGHAERRPAMEISASPSRITARASKAAVCSLGSVRLTTPPPAPGSAGAGVAAMLCETLDGPACPEPPSRSSGAVRNQVAHLIAAPMFLS
jgi:hypothetical protein